MTSAHTPTIAAPGVPARGAVVRLARAGMLACVLGWLGLGAAHAQHGRPQMDAPPQGGREAYPMPQRDEAPHEHFDPRSFDTRELGDPQARPAQQQPRDQNARDTNRHSRMTPDERRDLRRQINEAGMDLYPNRPRR